MRSPVAQSVEQVAVNHRVASSSLARGATTFAKGMPRENLTSLIYRR